MTTRTTHRSTAGKKLYAVRGKDGRFKDVQRYKRAHAQDLRTRSREEESTLAWGVYSKADGNLMFCEEFRSCARLNARLYRGTVRRVRVTPVKPKRRAKP